MNTSCAVRHPTPGTWNFSAGASDQHDEEEIDKIVFSTVESFLMGG